MSYKLYYWKIMQDFNKGVKIYFRTITKRRCSQFSYTVSNKIDLTAYGLHIANPLAWEFYTIFINPCLKLSTIPDRPVSSSVSSLMHSLLSEAKNKNKIFFIFAVFSLQYFWHSSFLILLCGAIFPFCTRTTFLQILRILKVGRNHVSND